MKRGLDLDAIRERLEAATPGPWTAHDWPEQDLYGDKVRDRTGLLVAQTWPGPPSYSEQANAEFIAHSRTDVAALLDEVDRLRTLSERLASRLDYHAWGSGAGTDAEDDALIAEARAFLGGPEVGRAEPEKVTPR